MYRLTERRLTKARNILEQHREDLYRFQYLNDAILERELATCWKVGYRELKGIFIDLLKVERYRNLAAYYMQFQNAPGPVFEFKDSLARLYGCTSYHAPDRDKRQRAYWERALAERLNPLNG
jgi:hypothetical protein